ncbi:hypothetical protein VNO77_37752 [Canavalia gladiata]|uniref:Uncharacterized protein n=1 Tax=Canavalia gladiata TaxID=3824 RepID=A0AAN9K971_CANGL
MGSFMGFLSSRTTCRERITRFMLAIQQREGPITLEISNERLGSHAGRHLRAFYYAWKNRTPLLLLWLIEYSGLAPNNPGIPSRSQILVYHHVTTSHRVITDHEYVQA